MPKVQLSFLSFLSFLSRPHRLAHLIHRQVSTTSFRTRNNKLSRDRFRSGVFPKCHPFCGEGHPTDTSDDRRPQETESQVITPCFHTQGYHFATEILSSRAAGKHICGICHYTDPTEFKPAIGLMGVCSRWRRIVLDTPQLWTKITGAPPKINSWIVRSKELPLRLDLDLDPDDSNPVLEALVPHAHRWEHVDFSLGQNSLSILAHARTRLHSLKRLNLDFNGGTIDETLDFCEVAPRLTDVRLAGIERPITIKLPWEQLTACAADDHGLALYALQHAKNLRKFHLDMTYFEAAGTWWSTLSDPHCCHTSLRTLIIHWSASDPDSVNSFVSSITLPSLRNLEIDFHAGLFGSDSDSDGHSNSESGDLDTADDESEIALINLSRFFERSSAHLSTLTLAGIPSSPDRLIGCLTQVPSLVSLSIHFNNWQKINNKVLLALNVNLPGYILPRLHSLSLRGRSDFSKVHLDNAVASRREIDPENGGVALLENLTLECSIPMFQSTRRLPQFHRFVTGGLNIMYGRGWSIYNDISESLAKGKA